jgi:hypothetical protein
MIFLMSIFLISSTLIIYHHVGYPVLLKLITKVQNKNAVA